MAQAEENLRAQRIEIKQETHMLKKAAYILLILAIIFGVYMYWPNIANAYEYVKDSAVNATESLSQVFTPLSNPQQTVQEYQGVWKSPEAKDSQMQNELSLKFINPNKNIPLSVLAGITIKADSEIKLKPQCLLDGKAIESTPSEINVNKSETEQHFETTCSSSESGNQLSVKIEIPSTVKSNLIMTTGKGENLGIIDSVMDHSSPYSILLTTSRDQPLPNGEHSLLIKIKRELANSQLERIDSLKVSTDSKAISIDCPFGEQLSGDRKSLQMYSDKNNAASDAYIITCKMNVERDSELLEKSSINAEMSYVSVEEFKTTLNNINIA